MHDFAQYLWLLPTAIASFGVKFLRDLSISVGQIKTHIAVLIERDEVQNEKIKDHEKRLRTVERN